MGHLQDLEGRIEVGLRAYADAGAALREIRESRLYRPEYRTFEDYCKRRWNFTRARATQLIQAAHVSDVFKQANLDPPPTERQARELVATVRTLEQEFGQEIPAEMVRSCIRPRMMRERSRERLRERLSNVAVLTHDDLRIKVKSVADLTNRLDKSSVDMIFTDPPYPLEFLPVWNDLAAFAMHALKPGRLLITYSGSSGCFEHAFDTLREHLEFVCVGAIVFPTVHNTVHQPGYHSGSKPLLFFSKGRYLRNNNQPYFNNTTRAEAPLHGLHVWEQSITPARQYIEKLTEPGELVCDPFVGSGTTAVAARQLNRRFVGCDTDPEAVAVARQRVWSDLDVVA